MQQMNFDCPKCSKSMYLFYNHGWDAELKCLSCGRSTTPSDLRISRIRFVKEPSPRGEERYLTYENNGEGVLNIKTDSDTIERIGRLKTKLKLQTDILVEAYSNVATALYPEVGTPLDSLWILKNVFNDPNLWLEISLMQDRLYTETSEKYHIAAAAEALKISEMIRNNALKLDYSKYF